MCDNMISNEMAEKLKRFANDLPSLLKNVDISKLMINANTYSISNYTGEEIKNIMKKVDGIVDADINKLVEEQGKRMVGD
jgi:hypothetical protein